ncbi:unnamed protein product, partial [Rotaria sp. Silwood1]
PRFIYNDPQTASRRRTTVLAMLKRKNEARFFEKKCESRSISRKIYSRIGCYIGKFT